MVGTVIEHSLADISILSRLRITKTWREDDWILHDVEIEKGEAELFGRYLTDGPWYVHFWNPGSKEVLVVFKNKIFHINYSDKNTWKEAVAHGISIGIPEAQLDFKIE